METTTFLTLTTDIDVEEGSGSESTELFPTTTTSSTTTTTRSTRRPLPTRSTTTTTIGDTVVTVGTENYYPTEIATTEASDVEEATSIPPFIMGVIGGSIFLFLVLLTVLALVFRINRRRKLSARRKYLKHVTQTPPYLDFGPPSHPPYTAPQQYPTRSVSSRYPPNSRDFQTGSREIQGPSRFRDLQATSRDLQATGRDFQAPSRDFQAPPRDFQRDFQGPSANASRGIPVEQQQQQQQQQLYPHQQQQLYPQQQQQQQQQQLYPQQQQQLYPQQQQQQQRHHHQPQQQFPTVGKYWATLDRSRVRNPRPHSYAESNEGLRIPRLHTEGYKQGELIPKAKLGGRHSTLSTEEIVQERFDRDYASPSQLNRRKNYF